MNVVLLHGADAAEPPEDPVLPQIESALRTLGHEPTRVGVDSEVEPVIAALRAAEPALVFNLAESFGGKSALESNVAALLNLIGLRYTGSSPAALLMAGDKSLTKKVLSFHSILTPQFATLYRGAGSRGRPWRSTHRQAATGGCLPGDHVEERGARHSRVAWHDGFAAARIPIPCARRGVRGGARVLRGCAGQRECPRPAGDRAGLQRVSS